jgi:hypothetical protein
MRELNRTLRIAGIVIAIWFAISLAWAVLLGPAALFLLTPRH